jgi:hypothetical protein
VWFCEENLSQESTYGIRGSLLILEIVFEEEIARSPVAGAREHRINKVL